MHINIAIVKIRPTRHLANLSANEVAVITRPNYDIKVCHKCPSSDVISDHLSLYDGVGSDLWFSYVILSPNLDVILPEAWRWFQ